MIREKKLPVESSLTNSEQETETFGAALANRLSAGSVVALTGELGAGKTCLVRGICRGLGTSGAVRSPTFSLLHIYESPAGNIFHFDAYRLKEAKEGLEIGMEEYLTGKGICLVEWADQVAELLPADSLWVEMRHKGENRREILINLSGKSGSGTQDR